MKKILLVSDDAQMQLNLNAALYRFNIRIVRFENLSELKEDYYNGNRYIFYVIDVKTKDLANFESVKFLRDNGSLTPVMILVDKAIPALYKKIYYAKYDDFMVKPFLPEEFLFRVFRNCRILLGSKFELKNGAIYDKNSLTLHINGTNIMLGKKEGLFLEILAKNAPHVVTIQELEWGIYKDENVSSDRLRSLVRQLRAKLPFELIKTVRSIGYSLEE